MFAACGPLVYLAPMKYTNTTSRVPEHIERLMTYWLSVPTQLAFGFNPWCSVSHVLALWGLCSNRFHVYSAGNKDCSLRSWWKWSSISGFWRRVTGVSWTAWSHLLLWIWWTTVSQSRDRLPVLNTAKPESRPWPHHYHELLWNVTVEGKWWEKDNVKMVIGFFSLFKIKFANV